MHPNKRKTSRNTLLLGLSASLAVLFLSGCEIRKAATQPPQLPPEVSFVPVVPEKAILTSELPGRVSPLLIAEVRPQVGGIIQKRFFEEGSDVKEGEILYQIDDALFKASYDKAKADLARAEAAIISLKRDFERNKKLVSTSAVSQKDYDTSEADLAKAEAEILSCKAAVETARINLSYTKIIAPISGRIGKSQITEGALVTANHVSPLAIIQKIDPVYVDVTQSNASLLKLKREISNGKLNYNDALRTSVKLLLEDNTFYPFDGTLQFRDITIDQSTGSFILRIVFKNPDRTLLPGMFVQAVLDTGVNEKAILIPQQSVSRDVKGRPTAFVIGKDDKIEVRLLELEQAIGSKWLVTSGLAAGDRVVVEGLQMIRPGTVVSPVPFKEDAAKGATQSVVSK